MVQQERAVQQEQQQEAASRPSSISSPRVEHLAYSPVSASSQFVDDSMAVGADVSDLSLMLNERESKISVSFAPSEADGQAALENARRILNLRSAKAASLHQEVHQAMASFSAKSPVKNAAVELLAENSVNQVPPTAIPRPGMALRTRSVRGLATKSK